MSPSATPDGSPAQVRNNPEAKLWTVGTLTYTTGGLILVFIWLLWGDFSYAMRDRSLPSAVQLLFRNFGASDALVGFLIISLPAALGLFLNPIVAFKSDRFRSRWGRRIPFLAFPTPFIVMSMVGMAFSPQLGPVVHGFLGLSFISSQQTVLIILGLFWVIFEIGCNTANSLFGALVNDVVPQLIIGRFFALFRVCSLLAGILLNNTVMGKIETEYIAIFIGIGILYGIGFMLMCFNVKEGEYPPPPELINHGKGSLAAIKTYVKDNLTHPYYLLYFCTIVLLTVASVPFNSFSLFYAKTLDMDLNVYFKCIANPYCISLILAYPLGILVDRFHPLRIALVTSIIYGLCMLWAIFYVKDAKSFTIVLMAHTILSGCFYTASASLGQRLLPRLKFAEFDSARGALNSLSLMAVPPILGALLDQTHHEYRYIFHAGLGLSVAGVICGFILYRSFIAHGGTKNYKAPEV